MFSSPIDFTDGDTFKRVTITDAQIVGSSQPNVSIRKIPPADQDDAGWTYIANVVDVATGSFTVQVTALSADNPQAPDEYPNESIILVYSL